MKLFYEKLSQEHFSALNLTFIQFELDPCLIRTWTMNDVEFKVDRLYLNEWTHILLYRFSKTVNGVSGQYLVDFHKEFINYNLFEWTIMI